MARPMSRASAEKLRRYLNSLPAKAQKAGQAQAFAEAEFVAQIMRSKIAVKSGVAKTTIRVRDHRSRVVGAAIMAGGKATEKKLRKGYGVFDYTRALEFGTRKHRNGSTGTSGLGGALKRLSGRAAKRRPRFHPGAKKYPFFWPAYRLRKRAAKTAVANSVKNALGLVTF